ncbi:tRNA(m(1)G37)methyltransferase [Mycoemilia scoparia]|uniref:tRNA (guanine(37)-N1)-methyltransferase n=1 Tax=Mycoemilia scoparia TaxID=417184 RepID=A0A9W7ZSM2_9FUNG|nr:tRNA(m(1)G37)methyltransferase [Mycoemilia scoparia]
MTIISPPENRGMTELDRDRFKQILKVHALEVPAKDVGSIMQDFSNVLLNTPRLRNVVNSAENDKSKRLVLLSPDIHTIEDLKSRLSDDQQTKLAAVGQEQEGWRFVDHDLEIPYTYWTADQILRSILPDSTESPTAYEQVGHIAHMNLRDQYLAYKHVIGQVILDKSPTIETVVNKLETIDNTYRNFKMEVIAGKPEFIATTRENGCRFTFDFSKVYWNSRLHTEHERITETFKKGDLVCDAMAGVGPFAIPAARNKRCTVWVNDLNPASYDALKENVRLNKVSKYIKAFNMDAREFIRYSFSELINKSGTDSDGGNGPDAISNIGTPPPPSTFSHVVMNLPGTALEFLDAFRGVYFRHQDKFAAAAAAESQKNQGETSTSPEKTISELMPMIHCHCFSNDPDDKELDIKRRACQTMGIPINDDDPNGFVEFCKNSEAIYVRKVSPKKDMFCLTFRLPRKVAFENFELPSSSSSSSSSCNNNNNHQSSATSEEELKVEDKVDKVEVGTKRKEPPSPSMLEQQQEFNNKDLTSSPSLSGTGDSQTMNTDNAADTNSGEQPKDNKIEDVAAPENSVSTKKNRL